MTLVCCCTIQTTKANEIDQAIDNYDPIGVVDDEMELFQRAAPRLGRASPRLGRASPRLGRRTISSLFTRFNHAGRYRDNDDDSNNDNGHEFNAWMHERRAAPRLGR